MDSSSEDFIRSHWYQIAFGTIVLMLVIQFLRENWTEWMARLNRNKQHKDTASLEEKVAAARARQQAMSNIVSAHDTDVRAEKERAREEEKLKRMEEAQKKVEGKGNVLGSSGAPAARKAPSAEHKPVAKPTTSNNNANDSDDEVNGPRKKLPKLSGGERDTYRPYAPGNDGTQYRSSNRFKRDCGPKGG